MVSLPRPKGNGVNIPQPGHGDRPFGVQCGNTIQLGGADVRPGKSFLFSIRIPSPGMGSPRDRDGGYFNSSD